MINYQGRPAKEPYEFLLDILKRSGHQFGKIGLISRATKNSLKLTTFMSADSWQYKYTPEDMEQALNELLKKDTMLMNDEGTLRLASVTMKGGIVKLEEGPHL